MKRQKYPRTFHFPFSLGISSDDKIIKNENMFDGGNVVVSVKMDGENITVYSDGYIHARSIDGGHASHDFMKRWIWNWCTNIPDGYRVCGEYLYAKHSISYRFKEESELFQVFGIYDSVNCISWEETCLFCSKNNLKTVPVIYKGIYDKQLIMNKFNEYENIQKELGNEVEGFVVRNVDLFNYSDFSNNVAKYVRKNHVKTDEHWKSKWERNIIEGLCND